PIVADDCCGRRSRPWPPRACSSSPTGGTAHWARWATASATPFRYSSSCSPPVRHAARFLRSGRSRHWGSASWRQGLARRHLDQSSRASSRLRAASERSMLVDELLPVYAVSDEVATVVASDAATTWMH